MPEHRDTLTDSERLVKLEEAVRLLRDVEFFFENNPGSVGANEHTVRMVDGVLIPLIEFWKEELKAGNR